MWDSESLAMSMTIRGPSLFTHSGSTNWRRYGATQIWNGNDACDCHLAILITQRSPECHRTNHLAQEKRSDQEQLVGVCVSPLQNSQSSVHPDWYLPLCVLPPWGSRLRKGRQISINFLSHEQASQGSFCLWKATCPFFSSSSFRKLF